MNYIEISPGVSDKKLFKVFYIVSPDPWQPCFLTNNDDLYNHNKDHQRNISAKFY